jgi:magnesium transporter
MFYQISENLSPVELTDISEDILTIGIISLEELEESYTHLGFALSTVNECKNDSGQIHSTIDAYDNYHFGIIIGIDSQHIVRVEDRIGIYIKKNLFLIVIIEDKDDSIRAKMSESLEHLNLSKVSLEKLVYGFLERIINDDYSTLEMIEKEISDHEDNINDNRSSKNFNYEITKIRKRLLLLDNYYDQLIMIGEELEENAIDLFEEKNLRYFKMFTDRATRLSNNTRMLQEYSIHVREAYHAQLEYAQNNIMKMFTVVTTVFLPLTLIVGWYGMNFTTMPELTWKFGYLYVIIVSIIVAILCLLYFKKKKFL